MKYRILILALLSICWLGSNVSYGTEPIFPPILDIDGDGLDDLYEIATGTDPFLVDTDGDGFDDYLEYLIGSDPNDPASPVPPPADPGPPPWVPCYTPWITEVPTYRCPSDPGSGAPPPAN